MSNEEVSDREPKSKGKDSRMSVSQLYQRTWTESLVGAPRQRGLFHMLRRCVLSLTYYPYVVGSYLRPILSIISQEIRSCFLRIEVQRRELNYIPVTRSYSAHSPTQHPTLSSYNQARSACILEMAANHPWATRVDLALFLEGWDMGEKWASHKDS